MYVTLCGGLALFRNSWFGGEEPTFSQILVVLSFLHFCHEHANSGIVGFSPDPCPLATETHLHSPTVRIQLEIPSVFMLGYVLF